MSGYLKKSGVVAAMAVAGVAFGLFYAGAEARAEAILQVFNQSHNEIAARLPEIAEAGYTALWVPPPTKANGGMSVGYDLNDPFDIGNSDLRGTWSTRYGVEADLHNLIELCHRFGMRVYFDNVMNHRSYDIPGYNESTPTDVYPGMCPEDFHLRTTSDGFYRKWDNVRDWNDEWQVMFLGLSDLLDIAHETPNQNFGATEGSWHDKPSFVRHPNNPEYYDRKPNGDWVGFGPDNGLTKEDLANNPDFYKEDVGGYLCRAVRWLVDRTRVDGLRLDAVKHVPYYFFGEQGNDASDAGYVGQVQWQFNMTRGFRDWDNHRDTVFNSDLARNDAMLFGEHLGNPPPQGPYVGAGMRLVDDRLRNELNWRFSANQLEGFDNDGAGSELGSACGVMHAQSHDNDYVDRKPLHHAFYFMHKGLGLVYSDGNNHAATLTGSGGAFPRWAQTDFLGQWQQKQIPTLLHAHENFARYDQIGKWSQGNFIAWQRGGDGSFATMLFQLNSSWDAWDYAHTSGDFPSDAYLYDYASDMYMPHKDDGSWSEAAYAYGGELSSNVKLPPNSYAIWNWKNPDPSGLYPTPYPECFVTTDDRIIAPDSRVITLMEDGKVVEPVWVWRKDGVDGDPDFNPYGVADTNNTDYAYRIAIPRVTKGTDVTLAVKADGSAESMRLRLDGGMDFGNGIEGFRADGDAWGTPDLRDSPPGAADDFWLGFEDTSKWFTRRIWSEKFASVHTDTGCKIGTQGATSYESADGTVVAHENETPYDGPRINEPGFVYHDPTAETETVPVETGTAVTTTNTYSSLASVNGQGGADGFGDWVDSSTKGDGNGGAGWFLHDSVGDTGLTGFTGGQAYGLWAKYTEGGWPNAQVTRSLSHGGSGLLRASVDVGMKFDSNIEGRYKGVEFTDASGNAVFGVQMENTNNVTYYGAGGGGIWSEGYGEKVFRVELERTSTGYTVRGTTRLGGEFGPFEIKTSAEITGFKAYMNGVIWDDDTDNRQLYFDNLSYTAVVTTAPTGDRQVPQFTREGTGATIWAKTSHEQGARTYIYYTVDGDHWPEGGGGVPANPYTKAVEGSWKADSEGGSWWRFDLPAGSVPSGATLRYKISAFREMGYGDNEWGTIWPGDGNAVWIKKAMMSLWTINGLDFTKQSFHKHNDYTSWTTGFKDGYHLATARVFLNRNDGAPVANTFRQTFYLDLQTPEGKFMYPAEENPTFGEAEYGMVFKTDNTVDEVWVHVTDSDDSNDTIGNGVSSNGVEWARATQISPWTKEDAQDTQLTKIWRWTYSRIPSKGTATIRVRLREVSSAPVEEWSKEDPAKDDLDALHVTELVKVANARGPAETFYIEWPDQDGTMVEAGWDIRVRYTSRMAAGLEDEGLFSKFKIYVNASSNGSTERGDLLANSELDMRHEWEWEDGNGLNTLRFKMPNVYNGIDGWRYALTVDFDNENGYGSFSKTATRMITHTGPLLPTCIITTPPETDSDGVKYVITMEDSTEAREDRRLRETPIVVLTDAEATKVELEFVSPTNYTTSISATPDGAKDNDVLRFVGREGTATTSRTWSFAWQVTNAGTYRVQAKVTVDNSAGKYSASTNGALRTATVRFRQLVHVTDPDDKDWDDDGTVNDREQENAGMPTGESEYWKQEAIFDYWSTGKSDPDCPDTDGDGLPDALELGYRVSTDGTDPATDTNGDGWPNFIWDRDPPFYNSCESLYGKVPGVTSSTEGGDRLALVKGSTTDPRNPDSDGDGIPDGVEDANRNGWTDGDGVPLPGDWDPYWDRAWPDGEIGAKETWEETSPCVSDSDADGLWDGYGEDLNGNGYTDLALLFEDGTEVELTPADYATYGGFGIDNASTANSASAADPKPYTSRGIDYGRLFAAYNVTKPDSSDGTHQTNGWPRLIIRETDPLCTDTDHDGLPDGWESRYQLDPLNNGVYDFRTGQFDASYANHGPAGNPDGDTYIQGGEKVGYDNAAEYLGGTNPQANDNVGGGEASGSISIGPGDPIGSVNGQDFFTECTQWVLDDLVALDDYNQGGNSSDIYRFGDGFDSSRDMVAFYFRDGGDSSEGGDDRLYFRVDFDDLHAFAEDGRLNVYVAMNFGNYGNGIDWLPDDVNCETAMKWNAVVGVYDGQNGCVYVKRDGEDAYDVKNEKFLGAWFNSELDTVVWSIDRKALTDAKWNGMSDNLMFQVYTTRDFTNDDGGSGDKGGLNDFADTIGDDWLCSDYWNDYNYISQHGIYSTCVSRTPNDHAWNNRGQHAKLAMVAHGNQAIEPGNAIQKIVDNGAGAGYGRPVKIHNIYTNCPLNLHITPTLAIALQWAEVGNENAWYSGPALNAAIRKGVANGALALIGSTYSDHIPLYFDDNFNRANVERATDILNDIYGGGSNVVSTKVLWSPERVVDADWLVRMGKLGYSATLVDQTPHLLDWFGRQTALGNDAYKIQRYWINTSGDDWTSADAFALSSAASGFRYVNTDSGLASDLRRLFLRRARTGEAAISSIFYMWEDFAGTDNADAYDRSLRWIANHPWIQVVTLDEALDDETLSGNVASHNLAATDGMAMQDWVHHACNGSYDNWYYGSDRHESLAAKTFEVREGKPMEIPYGDRTNGILKEAWAAVTGIKNPQLKALAEATIFASAFETAFHNEANDNLARWSYGEYIYPSTGWEGLMSMAWRAQSRTRLAAMYATVDEWTRSSAGVEALSADLDLDGEPEWIIRNNKVMAVFEAEGGLMTGAWYKEGTNVWQMVGNFAAQPETGYETQSATADSTRGTAMKDIIVGDSSTVADIFAVTAGTNKLTFKSGTLTKTVSLAGASAAAFDVEYSAAGKKLTVRNGLSPDLATLMVGGQARLSEKAEGNELTLATTSADNAIFATITVTAGSIAADSTDQPADAGWNTVNMRNAPQVRQVDITGNGRVKYAISFAKNKTQHALPTLTVSPPGDQSFPVGQTSSFRVTGTDWQGRALKVEATKLPVGQYLSGTPKWDEDSGVLSWTMGALVDGNTIRTNDWETSADFRTVDDQSQTAKETVRIIVPWDADGNGLGDDWEYIARRKSNKDPDGKPAYKGDPEGDADDDGFNNYSEWVAGTDPTDGNDYIALEEQVVTRTDVFLTFKSKTGAPYEIEETTSPGLVLGGTNWAWVATVTGTNDLTTWSCTRPGGESRMYRVKVGFFER